MKNLDRVRISVPMSYISFGNIAYCCEIDISRLKKAALGDFSGSPRFLRIGVPPRFHRGVRAMDQPLPGGFGRYLVEVRYP